MELSKIKLHQHDDLKSALKRIAEKVAEILRVERISVWRHVGDGTKLKCIERYERGEKAHSDDMEPSSEDPPDNVDIPREDRTITAHDALSASRSGEFAAPAPPPRMHPPSWIHPSESADARPASSALNISAPHGGGPSMNELFQRLSRI